MKNRKTNKKILRKTVKANTHKRKSKERAKKELLRAVELTNVRTDGARVIFTEDSGRGGRRSPSVRRDEYKVEGIFRASRSGFGFVTLDEEYKHLCEKDIFIPEDKVGGAVSGDRVEAIFHFYRKFDGSEKTEGRIIRITEYGIRTFVGTVVKKERSQRGRNARSARYAVVSEGGGNDIFADVADLGIALPGDKVEAELIRRGDSIPTCKIIRSFGSAQSHKANYEAILFEYDIPTEFSETELYEARHASEMPLSPENRKVRSREVIFTIDGEGAKDLDDAISLRKTRTGWLLGVHIADVSTYVAERSALDRAVMARGTSVYFVDKVVPMLPTDLSNGACSLNAGEEKYALSAMISLDKEGNIVSTKIEPSIIKSRVRGVYSEVNRIFAGDSDPSLRGKYREVMSSLFGMRELYEVLLKKSKDRGAIELESAEAEIVLDGEGIPCQIIRRERGISERLIEQFMLTANEAVARLLSDRKIPCVYRIHENPPPEKLSDFVNYMHNLGFDTRGLSSESGDVGAFSRLLEKAEERGLSRPVSYTMLRSMSKAKYSDQRHRHFGLGLDYYCHFTSPIRRLSDLATHRIIHKVLLEGKRADGYAKYAYRAAAAATEAELRAIGAERKIEDLYKTVYMSDKIGKCFDAVITSVTSFGFFAELDNTCEGLVPIESLNGFFAFDEKNMTIRSRDTVYRIGDSVSVCLEEADTSRGKLRFSVLTEIDT